jgi:hypothetical protein
VVLTGAAGSEPDLDPFRYRRWYETPLGRQVDEDEKQIVFALADLKHKHGERSDSTMSRMAACSRANNPPALQIITSADRGRS